jgi:hypothetical protein
MESGEHGMTSGVQSQLFTEKFRVDGDADGRFRFAHVPAAKYVLFSPDENDRTLWARNFEDYAAVLAEVEVGMKGTIEKDLKRRSKK